ncbi:MAG: hypothetical protein ACFFE2_02275 [Candidatus Thorarchaeota archaeon]
MRIEQRIGFLFLIIGFSLIAISFTGFSIHVYGPPVPLESDVYFGYVFGSGGSFLLEANDNWNATRQFSLYLLTLDDTFMLLEEQSIMNTNPLLEYHGISYFRQAITEFPPGKYGVVAIPDDGGNNTITMSVRVLHPFPEVMLTGFVSMGIGCVVITIFKIQQRYRK